MQYKLKFVNDIIRPWEILNNELIKQNSIDSNISYFISIASDIAIKINHFPEILKRNDLRSGSKFKIIVHLANSLKHNIKERKKKCKLSISSFFEVNSENKFRFIRNSIRVEHLKEGKFDFLELTKETILYLISKLNFNLFWNPKVLECPLIFEDEVFLNLVYKNQIAWSGMQIEFFKRNDEGILSHYDPPNWLFKLESPSEITATSYFDYIYTVLRNSINPEDIIETNVLILDAKKQNIKVDFIIKNNIQIIKLILCGEISINYIQEWNNILVNSKASELIFISRIIISKEIKEFICLNTKNIFLIELTSFEAINIPLNFFRISVNHNSLKIKSFKDFKLGILDENKHLFENFSGKPLSELNKNFSRDKENLLSLFDLCLSFIKPKNRENYGIKKLSIKPRDKVDIFFKINDNFIKVGIEVEFKWYCDSNTFIAPILKFDKNIQGFSIWKLISFFKLESHITSVEFSVIKYGKTTAVGII